MEYLQGRELRDILNDDKILPVVQIIDIIAQVAMGLSYAHEHEIVHRDIKPSNIMVIRDGHVKITDFGIARMASAAVRTQTGMVLGSPKYMSPEQVMGKITDQRSDIFSLGVMLYEMLTGQAPFMGENVNAIMYQTLNSTPVAPSNLNHDVPEMLNFIVAKALAKDLDSRYQDARDFANDLRACREMLPRAPVAKPSSSSASKVKKVTEQEEALDVVEESEESGQIATLGLSTAFDSMEATMRLASLTASEEDIEELSKTLQMARPSMDDINRAGVGSGVAAAQKVVPVSSSRNKLPPSANGGGYILLAIIAIVVIGLISSLVF